MKKVLIVVCSIAVLLGLVFSVYYYSAEGKVAGSDKKVVVENSGENALEVNEIREETVETEFPLNMSENQVENAIHYMSHQKVNAREKWVHCHLLKKELNVCLLLFKKIIISMRQTYLNILNKWKNKNFSEADEDHNAVWELLDGNTGKANGVLDNEEEGKIY